MRSYDRHLPEVLPWLNFTPDPQQVAERFSVFILAKGHVRASAGDLAVHAAFRVCPVSNSFLKFLVTPRGQRLFLSTGKHQAVGQLPRVSFSAQPGQSSDRPNLPPHKTRSIFRFLSPVFRECPPNHAVDQKSDESIVQRPNGQVKA